MSVVRRGKDLKLGTGCASRCHWIEGGTDNRIPSIGPGPEKRQPVPISIIQVAAFACTSK